jgi:hypothetical protein
MTIVLVSLPVNCITRPFSFAYLGEADVWHDDRVQWGRSVFLWLGGVPAWVVLVDRASAALPWFRVDDLSDMALGRSGGW